VLKRLQNEQRQFFSYKENNFDSSVVKEKMLVLETVLKLNMI
jgi:hypothetical protein